MMLSNFNKWSDGGLWGYVVAASAFMIQAITFGTAQSNGVYNVEYLDYFENSASVISMVGSINVGIFLGSGPIAGLLMNYMSHRQVALIGATISSIGLVCMPFTPNVEYMYFFYGVLTGLGYSLLYVPSYVLCGLYFHRHRSLVTGIAASGQGVGGVVYPYISYMLIDKYGWKGSFFLITGLSLHNFLFAALLRPPPKYCETNIDKTSAPKKTNVLETESKSLHTISTKSNDINVHSYLENNHLVHLRNLDNVAAESSGGETDLPDSIYVHGTDTNNMHGSEELVCTTFKNKIKDQLRNVLTFEFIIYFINNIFWNMGSSIVILFGPEFNINVGLEKENATIVFTLVGCGSCMGCVLGGLLGNLTCCNRIAVYAVANIAAGTLALLFALPFLHNFWSLLILNFVWGLMFGVILGLLMVVTADLLGEEALGSGYGYLMLSNGLGCSIAPPIAGWLLDVTGKLVPGFLFAGSITILGGLLLALIPLQHWLCTVKYNIAGNIVECRYSTDKLVV